MINTNSKPRLYAQLKEYWGAIQEVADTHGCHRNWVRMVLLKDYNDEDLEVVAAKVLIARKTKLKEVKDAKSIIEEALNMKV